MSADKAYDRLHGVDGYAQAVPRLTAAERGLLADRFVSWFGDERQAFLVSQIAPVVERIIATRVAELQSKALEMSRKAEQSERRAEGAEAEVERLQARGDRHYAAFVGAEARLARLIAAADAVGHQAACLVDPCDCWMSDLAPLLEDWSR